MQPSPRSTLTFRPATPSCPQVAAARLDALENDNAEAEAADDDSEYEMEEGEGVGTVLKKKGGAKGGKRTTRGAVATKKGPRSFAALLDEAMLDRVPREIPTYLTAAAGPSVTATARKYCSVCGFASNYNCARCGMKFCSRKCNAVHAETRCLKFTA